MTRSGRLPRIVDERALGRDLVRHLTEVMGDGMDERLDLTRFARDKYDHFALRSHLQSLGISLRSATEPIDDTSTGKLMEGVLAAFAQFDNDCRSDRTRAGMKAALELRRWVFLAPLWGRSGCAASNGQEPDGRSRASAACAASIRRVARHRAFHQGTATQAATRVFRYQSV